jgi:hypothetical protein
MGDSNLALSELRLEVSQPHKKIKAMTTNGAFIHIFLQRKTLKQKKKIAPDFS